MSGTTPSSASPWGGVELLERAIGYTRGALGHVSTEVLHAPTPCRDWDLWDLLVHMEDSLTSLHEAGSRRRVALHATGGSPADPMDLLDRLRARACQLLAEWSADWGRDHGDGDVSVDGLALTPRVLTSAGALEITIHGWDVAVACAADHPIPHPLATDLLQVATLVVGPSDRPTRFGSALPVAYGASSPDRLLAFLGRAA